MRAVAYRAKRRAAWLVALFLAGAPRAAAGEAARWGVLFEGGQASAPTSQHFAEYGGLALTRESRLGTRLGLCLEAWPFLLFNQTRHDAEGRERVLAGAASVLLTFAIGAKNARVGVRLEGGTGFVWSRSPVPGAGGSFNFLDQGGGTVFYRMRSGRRALLGYRRVHVSNLGLAGDENPGLSFHSLVFGLDGF